MKQYAGLGLLRHDSNLSSHELLARREIDVSFLALTGILPSIIFQEPKNTALATPTQSTGHDR